jgi:hypothetical protein
MGEAIDVKQSLKYSTEFIQGIMIKPQMRDADSRKAALQAQT